MGHAGIYGFFVCFRPPSHNSDLLLGETSRQMWPRCWFRAVAKACIRNSRTQSKVTVRSGSSTLPQCQGM